MIAIFTGLPGAGKSLKMARTAIELLNRNQKYWDKSVKNCRVSGAAFWLF